MAEWFSAGKWYLTNSDTKETIEGQFPIVDLGKNISNTYNEKTALSRQDPVTQFIHGNSKKITFNSRFFLVKNVISSSKETAEQKKNVTTIEKNINETVKQFGIVRSIYGASYEPSEKLKILEKWMERDPKLQRPPVCHFYLAGEPTLISTLVTVEELDIKYKHFENWTNKLKHVEFSITLKTYVPFELEGESEAGETYYHTVRNGDYYELVASRIYRNSKLGDVIRKRNPSMPYLREAYLVGFPRIDKIAKETITPKSIPFRNAFTRKSNPDKERWKELVEAREGVYYSNVQ